MILPLIIAAVETRRGWGKILISRCPGRTDLDQDLDHDIAALVRAGAAAILTLNDDEELEELGVSTLGAAAAAAGLEWFHLPIADYCAPDAQWEADWQQAGARIRELIRGGQSVHMHCRGGCGRSGTIAARLLVELGLAEPADAIRHVRFSRPCAIERPEQEAVVLAARPIQ